MPPQLPGPNRGVLPALADAPSAKGAVGQITPNQFVVHCKWSPYDVYIGRPSKWGNPFVTKDGWTRKDVIELYENWLTSNEAEGLMLELHELRGKVLGCWCAPLPCHGDVLARLANA